MPKWQSPVVPPRRKAGDAYTDRNGQQPARGAQMSDKGKLLTSFKSLRGMLRRKVK